MKTRFIKSILLAALFTTLASVPAQAGGSLPYVKFKLNNANNAVIARNGHVGFIRNVSATPDDFDFDVFNFNGLTVKRISTDGDYKNLLQISNDRLAWYRFDLSGAGPDLFATDGKKVRNLTNIGQEVTWDLGGKNVVWTAYDPDANTFPVYLNEMHPNNIVITEDTAFTYRITPKTSSEGNIVWFEDDFAGSSGAAYYNADNGDISDIAGSGQSFDISGHLVAFANGALNVYDGDTQQTEVIIENDGQYGPEGVAFLSSYDDPDVLWSNFSTNFLTDVSTGETINLNDRFASTAQFISDYELSDGFIAFKGIDLSFTAWLVCLYDIGHDQVRILATLPFSEGKTLENVSVAGPNVTWTTNQGISDPPFVLYESIVAYRLDEYVKILLHL